MLRDRWELLQRWKVREQSACASDLRGLWAASERCGREARACPSKGLKVS